KPLNTVHPGSKVEVLEAGNLVMNSVGSHTGYLHVDPESSLWISETGGLIGNGTVNIEGTAQMEGLLDVGVLHLSGETKLSGEITFHDVYITGNTSLGSVHKQTFLTLNQVEFTQVEVHCIGDTQVRALNVEVRG